MKHILDWSFCSIIDQDIKSNNIRLNERIAPSQKLDHLPSRNNQQILSRRGTYKRRLQYVSPTSHPHRETINAKTIDANIT